MRRTEPRGPLAGLVALALVAPVAGAGPGLATRDLNPILQPVFLPRYAPPPDADGWRLEHGLHITNTYQEQERGDESLVIDAENYRYSFDLAFRRGAWSFAAGVPLVASRGGQFDHLIEEWHDFFGLPQGGRKSAPRDRIEIRYLRDGEVEFSQTESSSGIGDVSLSLAYHQRGGFGYHVAVELPVGSESDYSGNESIDWALWLSRAYPVDESLTLYGLFGLSIPGDEGALAERLAARIWVAQLGLDYRVGPKLSVTAQLDLHSRWLERSSLKAFGNSAQLQLGLGFDGLLANHRLDLYFSEDVLVGSAPDISFGARLTRNIQ